MKKSLLIFILISTAFGAVKNINIDLREDISKISLSQTEKKEYIEKFKKEPVKFIFSIYDDYHFNRVDEGIKKTLSVLDYLQKKDLNYEIKSPYLRWKKNYQIQSTLYTLLGLLYIKKAGSMDKSLREKERKYILDVLKKKGKLTNEDLDYLAKLSRQEDEEIEKNSKFYIDRAIKAFQKAIELFPDNPYPYFQLAKFYKENSSNSLASKYLEKAAKLFLKYGQKDMYFSLIEEAKKEGYSKETIKRLEALNK